LAERATRRRLVNSDNAIICLCDILPKYQLTVAETATLVQ